DLAVGNLPADQLAGHSWTVRTDFNDAVPRGGFTFGILRNDVAAFIRALESVTDATVLANPKVLTLNKQEGHVIVGRRDGYLTTTVTETTATQTVEFLETGTRLFFRPFIADDGFVRLEIHPEDSSGGLNEQSLPFKRTTEVTTNIMVRDGHTVLIGGLFREALTTNRTQVPYAGNIPIAGALLQTNTDATEREEVIILLTVHVVKEDIYARKSAELAEDVELMRMGMRKGLQVYGRNRLAQAHYRWAVEHEEAGRLDKALWDARLAAHLAPTNLPALQLKNRLQEERETEREEGLVRDFVRRRIRAAPAPPAGGRGQPATQPSDGGTTR
ncbi:MAG: type II and III secretion system protein, partial [Planctomycetes bacterium]|nr:type II and III secretion system protein [Planctomycetota bacterium]